MQASGQQVVSYRISGLCSAAVLAGSKPPPQKRSRIGVLAGRPRRFVIGERLVGHHGSSRFWALSLRR
jgi:hypothetical protein